MIKISKPLLLADKIHNLLDVACRKFGYKLERAKEGTAWQIIYTTTKRGWIFNKKQETLFARISYHNYDSTLTADVMEVDEELFIDLMESLDEPVNLKATLVRNLYRFSYGY